MKPTFELFGIVLPSWHVMYVVAAVVSWWSMLWWARSESEGFRQDMRWLYCMCYGGGYFGARAFSIVFESTNPSWQDLFRPGAMTMYGGLLGALLCGGGTLLCRRVDNKAKLFDLAMAGGFLAIGIGRIGCFLNGDDFGVVSNSWFAVTFLSHQNAQPRVPIQLFESAAIFVLLGIVLNLRCLIARKWGAGLMGCFLVLGYACQRFVNEFYRGDSRGAFFYGFSPAQCVSVFCVLVVTIVIARCVRRPCIEQG